MEMGFSQLLLIFIILALLFIYQSSHVFKFYVRMMTYYSLVMITAIGSIFYSLPKGKDPSNVRFVTLCVKYLLMKVLGIKLRLRGKEHLESDAAAIMVVNHQSSLDMMPLFYICPKNCVVMVKREILWFSGPFGLCAWLCGTIWMDRRNPGAARNTMDKTVQLIKDKRLKVAVFPEGTRNHKGSMIPFKKGAFHLAVQGQVPIIPVVVSSYDNFYSKPNMIFNEGNILVQALPPIPTEGLTAADVTDLTERTRTIMLEAFDKVSEEVKLMK